MAKKHKIFVIHGMGKHGEGWWEGDQGVKNKVKKIKRFDKYKIKGKTGIEEKTLESLVNSFEWIELNYDEKCEKLRTAPNNDGGLDSVIAAIKTDSDNKVSDSDLTKWKTDASGLVKKLTLGNSDDFIKDNIWDVFLCSMKLTRHYLALGLAKKIITEINKDDDGDFSVLAISLGTALVQDVLHLVHQLLDGNRHQLRCVCLLADFSETLIGDILVSKKPYSAESRIYPSNNPDSSICKYFISARHAFDPLSYLAKPVPATLENWGTIPVDGDQSRYWVYGHKELGYIPDKFSELDISDIDLWELGAYNHSAINYLSSPLIHLPFFVTALGRNNKDLPRLARAAHKEFAKENDLANVVGSLIEKNANKKGKWMSAVIKLFYNLNVSGSPVTGSDVHV